MPDAFFVSEAFTILAMVIVGGMGTLIGTPTNTIFAGFMQKEGMPVDFAQWMLFATPTAARFNLSLGPSAARARANPANNPAPINALDCCTN